MVLKILSLGAGVQSTTMALMAAHGEIDMPDAAIFADTGAEPRSVYDHLDWLMSPNVLPFPVYVCRKGDLAEDGLRIRRSKKSGKLYLAQQVPGYTRNSNGSKGMLPRKCTRDYKISVIQRKTRELLGLKRVPKGSGVLVIQSIGISTDEAHRMKPAPVAWAENSYPLIDKGMSRQDCFEWMAAHDYPRPPRSACTFCPYHSDDEWLRLKNEEPEEFKLAVEWERKFQHAAAQSEVSDGIPYLHASRVPLDQVEFVSGQGELQFGNECEGMCGV